MTAHPNAHIFARLAEIAKTDPKPWKRVEVQICNSWVECSNDTPLLHPDLAFRIKPATVNIGGVELEGPLREAPEEDTRLWLLFASATVTDVPFRFTRRQPELIRWLNEGRLFASKEARDKYQDALVKLANGSGT